MLQSMSLASNGVDRVCSLRKIPRRLNGTNLCINCTGSTYFAPSLFSNERLPNAPKHYETHQNMSLGSNGVDRVDSLQKKVGCEFVARTFALIAQVQPILHRVSCSIETLPNAPKCYATQQNKSLGSTWLDWVCSLRKISRRLHGTYLCVICTSSTYFAPSFM